MKGLLFILLLFLGLLTTAGAADKKAPAPKAPGQKTPIEITADGDNRFEAGVAYAEGNVIVRYGEEVLYADSVTFDQKSRKIVAKGNVSIYLPGKIYRGDFLEYNVDSKLVKSLDYRTVQDRLYMAGRELNTPRSDLFTAKDSFISTENRENPSYRMQASTIELYPDELIIMKNVLIKIGNVPVMWLPYVGVPLGDNLDSFEFTVGANSRHGIYGLASYTAGLNDRLNMTVGSGYYSRRGIPYSLDFEFNPRKGDKGTLKTFFINDKGTNVGMDDPLRTVKPDGDRYRVEYQHKYKLSPEFDTTADLNLWSDRFVTEDFFTNEYRNNRQPDNFADLVYYDPNFTGTLLVRAQANNVFNVTERKPEFNLEFKRQPVAAGIFYEGETSVVNFERQFDRDESATNYSAVRYDTFHQLLYPKQYFGWLSVTPRVGARGTMYTESNQLGAGNDPEAEVARLVFNLGIESSFKLSRTWQDIQSAQWGIDGLRHVFQPYVNASYVPEPNVGPERFRGYDERLANTRISPLYFPAFNSIDSIDNHAAVRHGVRNRIQTKRDGLNVDLLSWDLYSQANIIRSPEMGMLADEVYSQVYSEATARPFPWLRMDSYMAVGISSNSFNELSNSISWQVHPALDLTLGHQYLWDFDYADPAYVTPINVTGRTALEDASRINLGSFWRLNENWRFSQNLAFDGVDGRVQEQRYEVYRDLRAWNLGVGTAIRDNRKNDDEYLVYFTLTLKAFPAASLTVDQ